MAASMAERSVMRSDGEIEPVAPFVSDGMFRWRLIDVRRCF